MTETQTKELHSIVAERESNICEITAIKHGDIIYEDYWHGYKSGDNLNVMSVTKSIMSLLTGIAIDKGFIKSTSQKVMDFFPDYTVKRCEKTIYDVSLHHLLTMRAPYKYKSEPWTKVCTSDDWTKAALDLLGGRGGITEEFKYSTLGIQILCGVIENASNMKTIDFANKYLFSPLEIVDRKLHGASSKEDQFDYLMNKGPRKNEWYNDPNGAVTSGWGLALSSTDMAKIGYMLIDSGSYNGKNIISEDWIRIMTRPYITLGERFGNMSYGYLWWLPREGIYAAIGDGGNVIYVNPSKDIAIGVAGTFKPRIFDRVDFIENQILPRLL